MIKTFTIFTDMILKYTSSMSHIQYNKFLHYFHSAQQSHCLTIKLPDTVDDVFLLVLFSVTTVTPGVTSDTAKHLC